MVGSFVCGGGDVMVDLVVVELLATAAVGQRVYII